MLLIFSLVYVVWRLLAPPRPANPAVQTRFPGNGSIALFALLLGVVGGAITNGDTLFRGGWHWQALAFAVWESFLCLSMCIGLTYAMRRYLNRQGKVAGWLVPNAYTAYIIHAVVIISLAIAVRDVMLYPLLKWFLVALVAVPLCFWLSSLIRKLPYTDRVL